MSCTNQKSISKIQGKSYNRSFIFKDKNGTAINLTGSVVKFSMKVSPGDIAHVISVSLTLTDAPGGKASLLLPMTMAVGKYYYEFEWMDALGYKKSIETGTVQITSSTT